MNCDQIKELLLTDYLDQNLSDEQTQAVDRHLNACPACREFAASVETYVSAPLESLERGAPSEAVWQKIRTEIESEQAVEADVETAPSMLESWKALLKRIRPVYAGLALVAILTLSMVRLYNPSVPVAPDAGISPDDQARQIEFMTYLTSENGELGESDSEDYAEGIEEYFLLSMR